MDPKMDSGFLHEGESLDEDYDVLRERLPEEILGIIDQLLCLEVRSPLTCSCTYFTILIETDRWPGILAIHSHKLF